MAVTESRQLQPDYIEALGKTYAADLTRQAGIPSITTADTQQPGETAAQFAQGLTGPMTSAQQTAYMSPYQSQVIDTALSDFDTQAAKSRLGLGAQAVSGGAFGSGRHGIAEAEFDAASNQGRASLQAQMLQQGFQQAQQARQQTYANQAGIANLQAGLGAGAQARSQAQISGLGTLGGIQQAQTQAQLDASRQGAQMAVLEPQQRLSTLGSGVMGLMGGAQGTGTTYQQQPQSSPLASALGIGSTLAGIYGLANRG